MDESKILKEALDVIDNFDDAFPNGVFATPRLPGEHRVKVRKLADYCKTKGIQPSDLSREEMEQFLDWGKGNIQMNRLE
ncbi:hypothetical protein [Brevibacillus choshinensis]|uniref:Uncharacterized protein n=1 Tax=Brevibacillus choshinensis TaxID=54911 RepID=A0ABX7FIR7_BRECH|nr:hypothetical protein [Brevibacillus choshinensis]QRG65981.1 hypothetical protein JNE38_20705 [Brevibacillus choshinensis]